MSAAISEGTPGEAGSWLRLQREAAGLTQEELADRAGLSVRAISNLERDRTRRPHPDSLRRVARGLGLMEAAGTDLILRYRLGRHDASLPSAPARDRAHPLVAPEQDPDAVARGSLVVPRQLPAAVAPFAGRVTELAVLDQWLEGALRNPAQAMMIWAIGGMAGVGKTALALQWAHRVADKFPDGQLYADLRGYDSGGQPADAAELVRGFLPALGIAPEQIPATMEAQTALYRSVLAGRRMLLVADNARNAAQVRPLLPGAPGSVVVVTSRSRLSGLVTAEGARMLNLEVLSEADAVGLLSARLGQGRVQAEPGAVAELVRLCGRLPLALAIVAARAELSGWPLAQLARQLAGAEGRLEALVLNDPGADVREVFSWSCGQLSREAARLFRLLAVHPGPDISVAAAASLAEVPVPRAGPLLRELAAASLASERVPGRYSLHDLVRAYAAEQAASHHDADAERRAAAGAMLRHYLHNGMDAAQALDPAQSPGSGPAGSGVSREPIADRHQALACCRRALDLCHQATVDPCLEGHIEDSLGYIYRRLGDQREAVTHYWRAVRTFRAAGAPQLAAQSLSVLGDCQATAGNATAAAGAWQLALSILGDLDNPDARQIRGKISELRQVLRNGSAGGAGVELADSAAEPILRTLR